MKKQTMFTKTCEVSTDTACMHTSTRWAGQSTRDRDETEALAEGRTVTQNGDVLRISTKKGTTLCPPSRPTDQALKTGFNLSGQLID
mmetsp:Transcript_14938/g.30178  ORF Transcript_14938/g.30178 Transcript_14938/m.30178 type:complete len:87 (+) Transcript_14938:457-717(+)